MPNKKQKFMVLLFMLSSITCVSSIIISTVGSLLEDFESFKK